MTKRTPETAIGPVRAGWYGRVSTDKQEREGTSLETQQERCEAEIEHRGWEPVCGYVDAGVSGAKASRPELDRLITDCRAGDVQAVVIASLDRLGRSANNLTTLWDEWDRLGVTVVYLKENIDSSTPQGRMYRNMMGGWAEFEREMIQERMWTGRVAVAREGYWSGGPAPYGYRIEKQVNGTKHSKLVIDEDEAAMFRFAVNELLSGRTLWQTAEAMNQLGCQTRSSTPWTYRHLRRTMRDSQPSGTWTFGRKVGWGRADSEGEFTVNIDPLITPAEHAEVRAIVARNCGTRSELIGFYLLSRGVLYSPCNRAMQGKSRRDRGTYAYRCPGSYSVAGVERCGCRAIPGAWLDQVVWSEVKRLLSDPEHLVALAREFVDHAATAGAPEDPASLDRRIAKLERDKEQRVTGYLDAGGDPKLLVGAMAEMDRKLDGLRRRAEMARSALRDKEGATERLSRLREMAAGARERLERLSPEEQRVVMDALDLRVEVEAWERCEVCGGSGKLKGGRGGLACPGCAWAKQVPKLRITGVWSGDALDECVAPSALGGDAPHTGALVRVETAGWTDLVGATRPS